MVGGWWLAALGLMALLAGYYQPLRARRRNVPDPQLARAETA